MRSNRPIRIAFLTSNFDLLGGSEKNILDLAKNLPRDQYEIYVLALKAGALLREVKALGIYAANIGLQSIASVRGVLKGLLFSRFLRARKIDILLTYHEDADIWGALAGKLANVPVILSSKRDMGYNLTPRYLRAYKVVNTCFSKCVVVSEAVKQELLRVQRFGPEKVEVIYNGVDTTSERPVQRTGYVHTMLGLPRERLIVGMVASFRPVKGQEFFLQAAREVLNHYGNVDFVISGHKETDYYERMCGLMQDLGIADSVHCIGHREDVPAILGSLDIFVLSSRHEGFSNAILEAMAAGCPVIAANSGGNREIVTRETGILFRPGDSEDLAKAIRELLADESRRIAMGQRAMWVVRDKFSIQRMVRDYEQLFASAMRQWNR